MISYLLNSVICAGFCWICYVLLFQSEKMHQFNRYYLLVSLGLSISIPLITIDLPALFPTDQEALNTPFLINGPVTPTERSDPSLKYTVLLVVYLLTSSIFALRLASGLRQLYKQIKRTPIIPIDGMQLVLNDRHSASYSFFNYLFIAPADMSTGNLYGKQLDIPGLPQSIDPVIWEHESAHARQKHSIDILLVEILKIICWFNPFVYLFKHSIQLNHEFLADENVIRKGQHVSQYQQLLLSKLTLRAPQQIVSSSVFSITKKRFIMMTQTTSKQKARWLKIAALPILGICLFAFSSRSTAQEIRNVQINAQDTSDGITQSEFDYYQKQVDKMRTVKGNVTAYSVKKIGGQKELNKLIQLYEKMSPAQKSKAINFAPPPPPVAPIPPNDNHKNKVPPPPPKVERVKIEPKVEQVKVEPKVEQVKSNVKIYPEPRVEKVRITDKKQIQFLTPVTQNNEPTVKVAPKKVIKFTLLQDVKVKPTAQSGSTVNKRIDNIIQVKGDANVSTHL